MSPAVRGTLLRLLPVAAGVALLATWFAAVEPDDRWIARNALPPAMVVVLSTLALARGGGRWLGAGWRWPLAVAGFAVPALGLSAYLHYAWLVDLDGMFSAGPGALFRYLPVYTTGAGAIGFAIGWLVGRNVN